MLRILNPEAITLRMRRMQFKKGEYVVPGPDWIWSIDGHDKLSPFGIEMYACVDAYSRSFIWVCVGIVNRTSHSSLAEWTWAVDRPNAMQKPQQSAHTIPLVYFHDLTIVMRI